MDVTMTQLQRPQTPPLMEEMTPPAQDPDQNVQYEDEDDPHGTFELEGSWTPDGKLLVKGIR